MEERFLTEKQLADKLNTSPLIIRQAVIDGKLRAEKGLLDVEGYRNKLFIKTLLKQIK